MLSLVTYISSYSPIVEKKKSDDGVAGIAVPVEYSADEG